MSPEPNRGRPKNERSTRRFAPLHCLLAIAILFGVPAAHATGDGCEELHIVAETKLHVVFLPFQRVLDPRGEPGKDPSASAVIIAEMASELTELDERVLVQVLTRSECEPEMAWARLINQKEQSQPRRGVILIWGLAHEQDDVLLWQSFVRFGRPGIEETFTVELRGQSFSGRLPTQVVSLPSAVVPLVRPLGTVGILPPESTFLEGLAAFLLSRIGGGRRGDQRRMVEGAEQALTTYEKTAAAEFESEALALTKALLGFLRIDENKGEPVGELFAEVAALIPWNARATELAAVGRVIDATIGDAEGLGSRKIADQLKQAVVLAHDGTGYANLESYYRVVKNGLANGTLVSDLDFANLEEQIQLVATLRSLEISDPFGAYLFPIILPVPTNVDQPPAVLAKVDGIPITEDEVIAAASGKLLPLEHKRHEIRASTLQDLVEKQLIEMEAQRRGVSPEMLIATEVDSKATEVTAAEIDAFYHERQARMGRLEPMTESYANQIRDVLEQQRREQVMLTFLEELEKEQEVAYFMEPFRVNIVEDGPTLGPPDAPVTIVTFSDFECPYCSRVNPTLRQVQEAYGDRVKVVFRQFPLAMHTAAYKASEASLCAQEQGKFWEMHDAMFANQNKLSIAGLKELADRVAGIDSAMFNDCLDSGRYAAVVARDLEAGSALGISGLPAFFVNGRLISGAQPFSDFSTMIDEELAASPDFSTGNDEEPTADPNS